MKPTIVSEKDGATRFGSEFVTNTEGNDYGEKAGKWWKYDEYTKVERALKLKWLGITWLSFSYRQSILGNYWKPAKDIVELVKEMRIKGLIPMIDERSRIFEPGCNVGRNLYYLQEEFNCECVGIDLSEKAIQIAEQKIWKGKKKHTFYVGNCLTTDFFAKTDDRTFDLVFTRWHLIHIPRSIVKRKYVENLKRIGKTFVILEPVKKGCSRIEFYHDGAYCLSWDEWAEEYGLAEYHSPLVSSLGGGTKVFFSNDKICRQV
jgi:SAM-dependent methyltransferase